MTNQSEAQGVFLAADLPLSWAPLGTQPVAVLEQWQHGNVTLLRALAIFETPLPDPDRDALSSTGKALERVEAKLDLALSLMSQLVRQQAVLPPPCPVLLRATSLEWTSPSLPEVGQSLLISLHLNPKLPQALMLPARVTALSPADGVVRIHADFIHLGEELAEWLERTVFRFHRRAIQQGHGRIPNQHVA